LVLGNEDGTQEADGTAFACQLLGGATSALGSQLDRALVCPGYVALDEELGHGVDGTPARAVAKCRKPGIFEAATSATPGAARAARASGCPASRTRATGASRRCAP